MATAETAIAEPLVLPPQRPNFSDEQRQLILGAAGELIRASVLAQPATFADPTLGGAAGQKVAGAFVSLKRNGHLRSCCGGLQDQAMPLGRALQEAAVRTALEDVRFPPVSPCELEHLEMEVWVLYNPTPITHRGEERVQAVTVGGKHGLVVSRGQARGLLLPGVAVEHNWDSHRFLEQVCVKAGLHPSLWKDDATALLTFEGESLRSRVFDPAGGNGLGNTAPLFGPEELTAYANFCRGNIALLLNGATPNYYLFGVSDGHVSGAILVVRRQRSRPTLTFSQISLRPGMPLQSTLFTLAQTAAQALANQGSDAEELDALEVGVTVLHDPAMHGTVADPHLAGLESERRAVLVLERSKAGLVFDPQARPEQLLAEAARQAQVRAATGAGVFSLTTLSTDRRVVLSTAPRPVSGPAVRPPGVAGRFYPGDPADLSRMVDDMLAGEAEPSPWAAALVPHAGLVYSGRIAAAVLKRIKIPDTVIVLGPKHTGLGVECAVAPHRTWTLPGFTVESDPELARQLAAAVPGLELDAVAHQGEHAIEVELPFLARLAPNTRVVGIAIGGGDLESCRRFAGALADVLRQRADRPLLLISSDMNHFATDAENRRLDQLALAELDRGNPEALYEMVTQNHISMCGVLPAVIVLETLRLLGGVGKVERVGYATSADVTGDTSRVVGYAGMLFGANGE
jgi:AmmeMemoRadiSam system protein B/AmmeMemoRadiSam system protein A